MQHNIFSNELTNYLDERKEKLKEKIKDKNLSQDDLKIEYEILFKELFENEDIKALLPLYEDADYFHYNIIKDGLIDAVFAKGMSAYFHLPKMSDTFYLDLNKQLITNYLDNYVNIIISLNLTLLQSKANSSSFNKEINALKETIKIYSCIDEDQYIKQEKESSKQLTKEFFQLPFWINKLSYFNSALPSSLLSQAEIKIIHEQLKVLIEINKAVINSNILAAHSAEVKKLDSREDVKKHIENMQTVEMSAIVNIIRDFIIYHVNHGLFNQKLPILFLLGGTGSGKSTTLCLLRGDNMTVKDVNFDSDHKDKIIGHDNSISRTFLPNIEILNDLIIIDYAGFDDTHGYLYALGFELALKALLKQHQSRIMVTESITNDQGRYNAAAQLGSLLGRIIENRQETILLGITKYTHDSHVIKLGIIEQQQGLEQLNESEEIKNLKIKIKAIKDLNMPQLANQIVEMEQQLQKLQEENKNGNNIEIPLPDTEIKIEYRAKIKEKEDELLNQIQLKKLFRLHDLTKKKLATDCFNAIIKLPVSLINPYRLLDSDHEKLIEINFRRDFIENMSVPYEDRIAISYKDLKDLFQAMDKRCVLKQMLVKPKVDELTENQFIIAQNKLWYFDFQKRQLKLLTFSSGRSLPLLLKEMNFTGANLDLPQKHLELIALYTDYSLKEGLMHALLPEAVGNFFCLPEMPPSLKCKLEYELIETCWTGYLKYLFSFKLSRLIENIDNLPDESALTKLTMYIAGIFGCKTMTDYAKLELDLFINAFKFPSWLKRLDFFKFQEPIVLPAFKDRMPTREDSQRIMEEAIVIQEHLIILRDMKELVGKKYNIEKAKEEKLAYEKKQEQKNKPEEKKKLEEKKKPEHKTAKPGGLLRGFFKAKQKNENKKTKRPFSPF